MHLRLYIVNELLSLANQYYSVRLVHDRSEIVPTQLATFSRCLYDLLIKYV